VTTNGPIAAQVRGLAKVFGLGATSVEALRGVDLDVAQGEFVAVMGPSGSGKSTLLHLIGGLESPTRGTVHVGGENLSEMDDEQLTLLRRRRIGFVFQTFNLLDVLSAEENVALPLVIDGIAESDSQRQAARTLELMGLSNRRSHLPRELSGGEQQRVAIARALVTEPLLVLADEPTGNLDSSNSDQIVHLLRNLVDDRGQTILMVTHDARNAAIADRIVRLRDGRVVDEQQLPSTRSAEQILEDLETLP
jgi:putative ABC transport system ATP-binding protein